MQAGNACRASTGERSDQETPGSAERAQKDAERSERDIRVRTTDLDER